MESSRLCCESHRLHRSFVSEICLKHLFIPRFLGGSILKISRGLGVGRVFYMLLEGGIITFPLRSNLSLDKTEGVKLLLLYVYTFLERKII